MMVDTICDWWWNKVMGWLDLECGWVGGVRMWVWRLSAEVCGAGDVWSAWWWSQHEYILRHESLLLLTLD